MTSAMQIAAGGMAGASLRLNAAAEQVARIDAGPSGTRIPTGTGLPEAATVDLSQAALDLIEARTGFAANAATVRVADETTRRLLDVRA
jgi:flagellar hook protein FlgE